MFKKNNQMFKLTNVNDFEIFTINEHFVIFYQSLKFLSQLLSDVIFPSCFSCTYLWTFLVKTRSKTHKNRNSRKDIFKNRIILLRMAYYRTFFSPISLLQKDFFKYKRLSIVNKSDNKV